MSDNQRRYSRIDVKGQLKATVYLVEDSPASKTPQNTAQTTTGIVGVLKDVSKGGIGLFVAHPVALKKIVRLTVERPGNAKNPKAQSLGPALEGCVVWSSKAKPEENAPPGFPYRLGIDLMPRDDSARDAQLRFYKLVQEFAQTL